MTNLNEYLPDDVDSIPVAGGVPDPIPSGDYMMYCSGQEMKSTANDTGMMLACKFVVAEGEHENHPIWMNFNIRNANAQAQQIGIGQLKAFCEAIGADFNEVRGDTSLLNDVPFIAKVGMSKAKNGYEPRNEIKAFKPHTPGAAPAPAAKAAAPAAKPAAAAAGARVPAFLRK